MIQNNSDALFNYLISNANAGEKNWFGFLEQRIAGVDLAYKMAVAHGDKMSAKAIVAYVKDLNDEIYEQILRAK